MGVLPKNWATVVVGQYQMQERLCTSRPPPFRDGRPLTPAWAHHGLHRPLTPDERRKLVALRVRHARAGPSTPVDYTATIPPATANTASLPFGYPFSNVKIPHAVVGPWSRPPQPWEPAWTGFAFKPPPATRQLQAHAMIASPRARQVRPQSARSPGSSSSSSHVEVIIMDKCSWDDRGGRGMGGARNSVQLRSRGERGAAFRHVDLFKENAGWAPG